MNPARHCPDDLKTIPERVLCKLREAIVEGEIPAGSKLSEADLANRYGISRGPLREVISQLAVGGLVDRRPNVGARVIQLSSEQLLDIYQVREALEGMAARLAAEHMGETAVAHLKETLTQHTQAVMDDPDHTYFQRSGDLDFHYQIVQGSASPHLIKLLCEDLYHLVRMYRIQFVTRSKRGVVALDEHKNIVDAIARRDGEMAELLMRSHIRASRENIERLLAESQ